MRTMVGSVYEMLRTMAELLVLFGRGHRWWLFPFVLILTLLGVFLLLAAATPLGPFIYTMF